MPTRYIYFFKKKTVIPNFLITKLRPCSDFSRVIRNPQITDLLKACLFFKCEVIYT